MKIRAVTIYWDDERDDTTLIWNPQFFDLLPIAQFDVMQDAVFMLEESIKELESD